MPVPKVNSDSVGSAPKYGPPKALLRSEEAAVMVGVSVSGLFQLVQRGLLPPARQFGTRGRWLLSDLECALSNLPIKARRPRKSKEEKSR